MQAISRTINNIPVLRSVLFLAIVGALSACTALPRVARAEEKQLTDKNAPKVTFVDHVLPIFREKCAACHNTDKKVAGLDLTNYSGVMAGGGSGAAIDPGNADGSYLYSLVTHASEPFMPPKSDKLPDAMLATISKWIEGGALETAGSKAKMSSKPKFDLSLKAAPTGKPEGPPPMPEKLSLQPIVHTDHSNAATALATSPWAPLAAVGGQKQVLLYHTQTLELLGVLQFPEGNPKVLKFSRNGSLLLAGGGHGAAKGMVVVWDVKTGERIFQVGDELDSVLGADISADQTMIALGGPGKVVRVYATADGRLLHEMKKHTDWIYSVSFSPDGVLLATSDRNGGLFVWEAFTGREYLMLSGHTAAVTDLSWRSDSNILASCSEDTTIRLWEMENGGQVKNWGAHGGGVSAVAFARDGRIVSTGRDRTAKVWDQNGKQLVAMPPVSDLALSVAICDETNRVIGGDWTGGISVWNAADAAVIGTLSTNPPTLAQRAEAANAQLAAAQAENAKLAEANTAAAAAATKIQTDLDAANKSVADAQAKGKTATDSAAQLKATLNTLATEIATHTKSIAELESAVPLLKDAAEKGAQAAAKVPDDKDLAAAAAQLKAQFDAKTGALEANRKALAEKNAATEKAKPELAAAEKQAAEAKTALDAAQKIVADLTPTLKPAQDKAAQAKAAADSAAQALAASQQAVARWKTEMEFQTRLESLAAQQATLAQVTAAQQEAQAAFDAAQAEVKKAQQAAAEAQKVAEAAANEVKLSNDAVAAAVAAHEAEVKNVATLEGVLPVLTETLTKGQEAVAKAPGDAEVAQAAAQIKALLDAKTASLADAKKAVPEKAAAIEKSQQQLAAAQKKAADTTAAVQAAQKVAADAVAATKPFEEKLAQAKKATEEAARQVDEIRKQVDAFKGNGNAPAKAPAA